MYLYLFLSISCFNSFSLVIKLFVNSNLSVRLARILFNNIVEELFLPLNEVIKTLE